MAGWTAGRFAVVFLAAPVRSTTMNESAFRKNTPDRCGLNGSTTCRREYTHGAARSKLRLAARACVAADERAAGMRRAPPHVHLQWGYSEYPKQAAARV